MAIGVQTAFSLKIRLKPGGDLATLDAMAKQALGRSLEALLDGGLNGAGLDNAAASQPAPVSPGVRSLMRGNQSASTPAPPLAGRKLGLPRWYLFGGDILLTAMALGVAFKSPHPLSFGRVVFCAAAVALGGCLALGAVWHDEVLRAGAGIMAHGKAPE